MSFNFLNAEDYLRILLLVFPLIVSGVLHMIIVKKDILSYFKKPIHPRWFGVNKTWRGFIVMPLATWPGVVVAQKLEGLLDINTPLLSYQSSFPLALALGLAYCLAELPNSFLKRRMRIKEGQTSERFKIFFIGLDLTDSAFGCLLVYRWLLPISWSFFWWAILLGAVIHLVFNLLLYQLKIRQNPL